MEATDAKQRLYSSGFLWKGESRAYTRIEGTDSGCGYRNTTSQIHRVRKKVLVLCWLMTLEEAGKHIDSLAETKSATWLLKMTVSFHSMRLVS